MVVTPINLHLGIARANKMEVSQLVRKKRSLWVHSYIECDTLLGVDALSLTVEDYQDLIDRGCRRFVMTSIIT